MTLTMNSRLLVSILFCIIFNFANAQQLDYFINKGLQNSPLLNEFKNQLQSAETDSLLITATRKPQVNSHSQALYAPSYKNFGYDNALTSGGYYGSVVDVSQNVFYKKIWENKYEAVRLQKQELGNSSKLSTSELKRGITAQYLTTFTDFQELKNSRNYLDLLNQHKTILKTLVEQGVYKQSDYLSLIIETQTTEIEINQLQTQVKSDEYALKQLCGVTDSTALIPELPPLAIPQQQNLSTLPLFVQFKIDSLKIGNERQSLVLNYKPKINWFADAGLISADPLLLYRHLGFSVGLSMSFPIYDGHQKNLETKKLDIKENTRLNYESYFKNQYSMQIRQLNDELHSTRKSLLLMDHQLQTTKELTDILKTQLNMGNASIVELINTMKNYLSAMRTMNRLHVREFEIMNELTYLMLQ